MPTGYTADVQSGKITEFNDFALQCARAFGACIMMRDEPADAPIPDEFLPSDYAAKMAEEARERLAKLAAMTPAQAEDEAQQDYKEKSRRKREYEAEQAEHKRRYAAMIAKVTAWTPPTPDHTEMKSFMLQQLNESIRFDCGGSYWEKVEPISGPEWLARETAEAKRMVASCEEDDRKERERAAKRTAWVKALRASLAQ